MQDIKIREATKDDLQAIQRLAHEIWPVTYSKIVSDDQLKYMLELIYSNASLLKQLNEGHHFLLVEEENSAIAFADYSFLKEDIYKLHKIYVLPAWQGKGIGKLLIEYVIRKVKENRGSALVLNVNRNNKAKRMYEHIGFKVIAEDDIDIGNGYFMNDYILSYNL